jgi:DNA-binding response OmpR family regulator
MDIMNQHSGRALVIDSEPVLRKLCTETLRSAGFAVEALASKAGALEALLAHGFDLVILDLLPGDDLGLLERIREQHLSVPILLISGGATVAQAAVAC